MYGLVLGDIAGSKYEFTGNIDTRITIDDMFDANSYFTDDTVCGLAVAYALYDFRKDIRSIGGEKIPDKLTQYSDLYNKVQKSVVGFVRKYPNKTYGNNFVNWASYNHSSPYNSMGNGSAMRVSTCGEYASSFDEALALGAISAMITHNHPEGIRGASFISGMIYLAKNGASKKDIKEYVRSNNYMDRTVDSMRRECPYSELCYPTICQAMACLFEADSFEGVLHNCVTIGADADTVGAIAGSVAEYLYGIQDSIKDLAKKYLPEYLMGLLIKVQQDIEDNKPGVFR